MKEQVFSFSIRQITQKRNLAKVEGKGKKIRDCTVFVVFYIKKEACIWKCATVYTRIPFSFFFNESAAFIKEIPCTIMTSEVWPFALVG